MTSCAPLASTSRFRELRLFAELLDSPRSLQRIEERTDQLGEAQKELSARLWHAGQSVQAAHRGVECLSGELGKVREILTALADRQDCLELASKQQVMLTQEHFHNHVVDPVASTLFELIDFCTEVAEAQDGSEASESLQIFASKIQGVLEGLGIQPIDVEPGKPADTSCMKIVSYQRPCADQDADGTVAHVNKRGFRRDRRILRYAEVELFRFEAPTNGTCPNPTSESKGESE